MIIPFCKSIEDNIPKETEKEFVFHLRKEILRLKKSFNKEELKQKKDSCVNSESLNSNNLNSNNTES